MAKISVEGTPVAEVVNSVISISGHMLLIFTDDFGNEFVIRGGPTPNTPDRGNLIVEINTPIFLSVDARGDGETPSDRGSIDLDLDLR